MEVGEFTIENTDEKSWGNYFLRRIINITSNKVIYYHLAMYLLSSYVLIL